MRSKPEGAQAESPPIRLRAYRPSELRVLHALDQLCFRPGISYSLGALGSFLRHPRSLALVAEAESGRVAGFVVAEFQYRRGEPVGHIITLDVHPGWRRWGIGTRLMCAAERRLEERGATAFHLEVAIDDPGAQRFYESLGYGCKGRIPGYYLGKLDALVMEKPLVS